MKMHTEGTPDQSVLCPGEAQSGALPCASCVPACTALPQSPLQTSCTIRQLCTGLQIAWIGIDLTVLAWCCKACQGKLCICDSKKFTDAEIDLACLTAPSQHSQVHANQ